MTGKILSLLKSFFISRYTLLAITGFTQIVTDGDFDWSFKIKKPIPELVD